MAENEKLFWDHLQHQICLMLNNSNAFYTWAHTWLGIKCPQPLSFNNVYAIPVTPVWTQQYCVVCSGTLTLRPMCTFIFMYVFNMQRLHSEFFSLLCYYLFIWICKMGFYYVAPAHVKFLEPTWFIWLDLWNHCAGTSQHIWLQTAPLKAPEIH